MTLRKHLCLGRCEPLPFGSWLARLRRPSRPLGRPSAAPQAPRTRQPRASHDPRVNPTTLRPLSLTPSASPSRSPSWTPRKRLNRTPPSGARAPRHDPRVRPRTAVQPLEPWFPSTPLGSALEAVSTPGALDSDHALRTRPRTVFHLLVLTLRAALTPGCPPRTQITPEHNGGRLTGCRRPGLLPRQRRGLGWAHPPPERSGPRRLQSSASVSASLAKLTVLTPNSCRRRNAPNLLARASPTPPTSNLLPPHSPPPFV